MCCRPLSGALGLAKEKILDQMDNDFGWHYLPKSEMGQNAVFMLITAIIRNFYERLLRIDTLKRFGIEARTRMKAFINRLIAVPAKWVRTGRHLVVFAWDSCESLNFNYCLYNYCFAALFHLNGVDAIHRHLED